jgi:hypothetical protein
MAYVDFDPAQPDGAVDDGPETLADVQNNQSALRDTILSAGIFKDYAYAQSGGTAERPTTITLTKGTYIVRLSLTWGDVGGGRYNVTAINAERSVNSGGAYETIKNPISFTYDANGNLTATSGGGGFFAKFMQLWGNLTKAIADLASHIAATGTSVHGLGSMSTQANTNVNIDGGAIDGTTIGAASRAAADVTRIRESFISYGQLASSGTATLQVNLASHFYVGGPADAAATFTIAISGAPASGISQTIYLELYDGQRTADGKITWPASFKWIGGSTSRPSDATLENAPGTNLFSATTRDGGATWDVMHLGKRG